MKTAIWILAILTVALGVLAYFQWKKINATTGASKKTGSDTADTSFGNLVAAFQDEMGKVKEVKLTF